MVLTTLILSVSVVGCCSGQWSVSSQPWSVVDYLSGKWSVVSSFHSHWSVAFKIGGRLLLGKWSVVSGTWPMVLYYANDDTAKGGLTLF